MARILILKNPKRKMKILVGTQKNYFQWTLQNKNFKFIVFLQIRIFVWEVAAWAASGTLESLLLVKEASQDECSRSDERLPLSEDESTRTTQTKIILKLPQLFQAKILPRSGSVRWNHWNII